MPLNSSGVAAAGAAGAAGSAGGAGAAAGIGAGAGVGAGAASAGAGDADGAPAGVAACANDERSIAVALASTTIHEQQVRSRIEVDLLQGVRMTKALRATSLDVADTTAQHPMGAALAARTRTKGQRTCPS